MLLTLAMLMLQADPAPIPAWADPRVPRPERNAACGACHESEFEDWKAGPHANSHKAVMEARDQAFNEKRAEYPHLSYARNRLTEMGDDCFNCHAPTDLYTAIPLHSPPNNFEAYDDLVPRPEGRETGVDCITCHMRGPKVMASGSYRPSPGLERPEGFCDPVPSLSMDTVLACAPCHEAINTYPEYVSDMGASAQSCRDCHLQKDRHYYYWSHDPADRPRPPAMRPFENVQLTVKRDDLIFGWFEENILEVRWSNDFQGHELFPNSAPTAYLMELRIDGAQFTQKLYVTSIADEDRSEDEAERFNPDANPAPRVVALPYRETIEESFELPDDIPQTGTVDFVIYDKSNVSLPDSYKKEVYRRRVPYTL